MTQYLDTLQNNHQNKLLASVNLYSYKNFLCDENLQDPLFTTLIKHAVQY